MSDNKIEIAEQEKMIKELVKKEMIRKIESKIKSGDYQIMQRIKNLARNDT